MGTPTKPCCYFSYMWSNSHYCAAYFGETTLKHRNALLSLIGCTLISGVATPVFASGNNTLCPALKIEPQYGRDCGYRITTLRYKPVKFSQAYTNTNFTAGTGLTAVGHMNDRFTVVGQAIHRDGKKHAIAVQINEQYAENHYYTDLGLANLTSSAGGVDNRETIVGNAQFVSSGASKPAFFRGNGSNYTPLPMTLLGGSSGMLSDTKLGAHPDYGYSIQYRVGWEVLADGRKHGVVWRDDNAVVQAIGNSSATSQALATNANGHAVGRIRESSDSADHAFIWNWDSYLGSAILTKLPSLGGTTVALDVNNNQNPNVVGSSIESGTDHRYATSWTGTTLKKLTNLSGTGNPNAEAYSVTDGGDIVGTSRGRATIWRDGGVHNLNSALTVPLTTTLKRAVQINRQGFIVAQGADGNYYLLIPAEHL